jgi:hypothetical protein
MGFIEILCCYFIPKFILNTVLSWVWNCTGIVLN